MTIIIPPPSLAFKIIVNSVLLIPIIVIILGLLVAAWCYFWILPLSKLLKKDKKQQKQNQINKNMSYKDELEESLYGFLYGLPLIIIAAIILSYFD